MLELRKITKIYATDDFKQTALDSVSITFKKNEETTTFYNDADGDANVDAGGNAAFCQCTAAPSLSEC